MAQPKRESSTIKMRKNEQQLDNEADIKRLLSLRFATPDFRLSETVRASELSPVMKVYAAQLDELGFNYSHEIIIEQCIGKTGDTPARILAYLNSEQRAYALLTDLYHDKSWVYFTHYFTRGRRIITTCQPGALQLEPMRELSGSADFHLQNTGSSTLQNQWKKHQQTTISRLPEENALLMDPVQHLDAEREAYRKYSDLLLDSTILRQLDTQITGFTKTGVRSYQAAITSRSARRPQPKVEEWIGKSGKVPMRQHLNYRNVSLLASAGVAALLVFNLSRHQSAQTTVKDTETTEIAAALPNTTSTVTEPAQPVLDTTPNETSQVPEPVIALPAETVEIAKTEDEIDELPASEQPEQYIIASEEDEMWRIAVENAEFYLMSNDGDPAPWIRTARKMAASFNGEDPRLARTYFLAALLERDSRIAEQQFNRALSIQTKTLGLYHAETAQTLEALAWVAEDSRDALEDAITHQRLALNIYRSIFGEEAEDTRAARWKLQYFEDRLAGRRPKSDDNRRLLPALAKFTR